MQSAPYLEGDNYYMPENSKSSEGETDLNSSDNTKEIIDEDSLREQLSKTEEEIITLRQVLNVKLKLAQDIKRQLGITVINEMKGDIIHGINTIKESNTFKATTNVMKNVKDKTSTTLSTASSKFSQKIGFLRNTNTFKSIEGKMGTAYTYVKQSKSMGSIPNKLKVPCKYNPGDKIFAKVKGFVYWPARVNPLPMDIAIPPNKIPIFFYGTHEVFFISPTSCWPYDEKNKSKWGKPRPRAHFNQGMDEIENHSTIYQYGVDPTAEDFLSQFYEFKRSNGQSTTPNKLNKQENREVENGEEDESGLIKSKSIAKIAGVPKKRNKSGSSLSMKENKNNSVKSNAMTELSVEDVKSPESINDLLELSQPTAPPKKRQRSGSALSAKENTNCEIDTNIELAVEIPGNNVATRKRQISGSDDLNDTIIIKSNKSRGASRKRQRNDSVKEEKVELKMELNIDDKSKINMDCDNLSKEPIRDDKKYDVNQTVILELMPASIVKLENNLDDKLISEMLKKDTNNKQSEKSNESCHSEQFKDNSIPKTRCRSKSTSKKVSDKKESIIESDTESDSLSVDSDNPDDEDFRPARKSKKFTKKIKSPKQIKSNVKKSVGSQPKRNVKAKTQSKKKMSSKVVSDDSLSSLSSVEEWNLPVCKEKKESEEKPKIIQLQSLQLNDSKEIIYNKTAESKSTDAFNNKNVELSPKIVKEESNEKIKDKSPVKEITQDQKNVEGILENEVTVKNYKSVEIIEEKEVEAKVVPPVQEDKCISESNEVVSESSTKKVQKDKEKKSMIIIDSGDEKDSSENVEAPEKNRKNKISLKEIKVNKIKSKTKPQLSRKRNRKLSSSSDSDVEIVKKESKPKPKKPKLVDRNSESDDSNIDKGVCDKLQILQNFNADIRSSLMLGKEDYKTCLERFKSLCEMQMDLISLVKVWQLMDTVKKCRRYKRNEQIKQEAQSVYKRFMDVYTQASKDEIATAQSLLAQYRHQNNVQHQNVGVESNKSNGLSIPISVADMFQNRLSDSHPNKSHTIIGHNKDESVNSTVSTVNSVADNLESSKPRVAPPTEEEINEEKMRLLSVDLEAKVSDILNKIEKNVEVMNQKSLSHLLPSTDDNFSIKLPTQWKSMNEKSTDKDKYDDNSDDEDEEDVEAIVRRIEEVPIKLPEPEIVAVEKLNINGGSSSALDARIENLFNSSFITSTVNTKDARQKKTKNSSRHHTSSSSKPPSAARTSTSPSPKLDNPKLDHQESVVIKNSEVETALVTANVLQEDQKDDIEIYDLLGV